LSDELPFNVVVCDKHKARFIREFANVKRFANLEEMTAAIYSYSSPSIMIFDHDEIMQSQNQWMIDFAALPLAFVISSDQRNIESSHFDYAHGVANIIDHKDINSSISLIKIRYRNIMRMEPSFAQFGSQIIATMKTKTPADITKIVVDLEGYSQIEPLAAYYLARVYERLGEYRQSAEAFAHSLALDPWFCPNHYGTLQSLLIFGEFDQALVFAKRLNHITRNSLPAQLFLLCAYQATPGGLDEAKQIYQEILKTNKDSDTIKMARAHILLTDKNTDELLLLISSLRRIDTFLAVRLNEAAIKLSLQDDHVTASKFYAALHRIVAEEFKHKISVNSALTSYRLNDYSESLRYCDRAESEFGDTIKKIQAIRAALKKSSLKAS
jgi:tetratricopeptide (TPR) repeat protein